MIGYLWVAVYFDMDLTPGIILSTKRDEGRTLTDVTRFDLALQKANPERAYERYIGTVHR